MHNLRFISSISFSSAAEAAHDRKRTQKLQKRSRHDSGGARSGGWRPQNVHQPSGAESKIPDAESLLSAVSSSRFSPVQVYGGYREVDGRGWIAVFTLLGRSLSSAESLLGDSKFVDDGPDLRFDRPAVLTCRFEPPFPEGLSCELVKPVTSLTDKLHLRDVSLLIYR